MPPASGKKITPPEIPFLFAVICNRFNPTGGLQIAKLAPVMVFVIFLPFIPVTLIDTLIFLPEKVRVGLEPVRFTLHFAKSSAAVAQAISLLLP
ncbi:unannotated protein [freshwater metagenome]|uniref:Unannotated protein n=1 Tax=freshwater metagenome TaxID=449393 RepID=A0A6J6C9B7_9ZZZZ